MAIRKHQILLANRQCRKQQNILLFPPTVYAMCKVIYPSPILCVSWHLSHT